MTALLTDEQIIVACHNHAQAATRLMGDTEERQEHLEYAERDFEEGARFARSIYEARLAEDAKVRAEMTAALEQARAWVRGDDEPKILMSRIEAALAAAKEIK